MSDFMAHACNPSIWLLEARESDGQDHFGTYAIKDQQWLHDTLSQHKTS